jgi:hypothetical protein
MAYKDLAQQRAYQRGWLAAKRQQAQQQQPLSLAAWSAQLHTLRTTCETAQQMLLRLTPDLTHEAIAGRYLAAVSEVTLLLSASKARLQQIATTLTELESCRRRLTAVVPEKQR